MSPGAGRPRGIILMKLSDRNGKVVGIRQVVEDNHIMLITARGVIIRMVAGDISMLGRNTQGVRLVRVGKEDRVQAVCNLEDDEGEEIQAPVESAADVVVEEGDDEPEPMEDEAPADDDEEA